jgi:hypothetical protein
MTVSLVPIQPADLDAYWPIVSSWVGAAASDIASWSADDWKRKVETSHAQLWLVRLGPIVTGVIITEIYDTAAGKTCALPIVGGTHMKESLPVLDAIESWAKSEGCTRLQGDGRKGWVKALQNIGWRPVSVQVEKGIS